MLQRLRYALGTPVRARARRNRAAFLEALKDCRGQQERTLARLLALHSGSDFLRDHGVEGVTTVAEYRRRISIADYERTRPYVERMKRGEFSALLGRGQKPLMFAMSSGTTAEPKYIPITRQYLADYRRGWQAWGIDIYRNYPRMHWLHILQLASNFDKSRTPAGTPCGNITGFVQHIQNPIVQSMYSVPRPVVRIPDPDAKYYATLRFALADPIVGMAMTANPSTLIQLGELTAKHQQALIKDIADGSLTSPGEIPQTIRSGLRLRKNPERARALEQAAAKNGKLTLHAAWPDMQILAVWTAGSASAYLPRLREQFPGVTIRDHGLSASEARMSITLADETRSAALDVTSHFYEFIPEEEIDSPQPAVLLAHELEVGRNYFILLTTSCALYRYDIRDVVRVNGFEGTTPLIEFLHKGANIANLTGEKITESQAVTAVADACRQLNIQLTAFTLTPVWGDPPGYQLLIETGDLAPGTAARLEAAVDKGLAALNCEYDEKRQTNRLLPIKVADVPAGSWAALVRDRQSRPSGSLEQYKHPCLAPDMKFKERLLALTGGVDPSRAA
jgi:hypothetical protein